MLLLRIHRPEGVARHHHVVLVFRLLRVRLLVSIVVVAIMVVVVRELAKATAKVSRAYLAENLCDHTYHLVHTTISTRQADRSIKEVSLLLGIVLFLVNSLFHSDLAHLLRLIVMDSHVASIQHHASSLFQGNFGRFSVVVAHISSAISIDS